ncbi:MAG: hypothetical protein O3B74_06240 [Proteobacteria bacterium]|nr:hypothetical protein [Pseudomonadota bacterium]MDA1308603.1 hypothetical protein [Pseudomonadota bacterium]
MLSHRTPDFARYVWDAAARVGRSAPRIVDDILTAVFPKTTDAAGVEGATKMLRTGCISEVKRVLHAPHPDDCQVDFAEVDPSFMPLVKRLQRPSYFVPNLDMELTVADLIANPSHLDAARCFIRSKGMECLAEADRLDRLYQAVIGQNEDASTPLPVSVMSPANAVQQSEVSI